MPDRPADVISQELIDRVERLVLNDRLIKIAELASEYGISNVSNYTIIHARWAPRNLNMLDRHQRTESSLELMEVYNAKSENFHTRLVTGDETCFHHCDHNTKKSSCNGSALARPHLRNFVPNHQPRVWVWGTPKRLY